MIPRDHPPGSYAAFTRTELVFIIFATIVIICLLTPHIIKVHRQKNLVRCNGNLKNVSLAVILWIDENELICLPWHPGNPAASTNDQRRNELWFHMISLSNQLSSPKPLVCPADRRARIAKTWDPNHRSGFGAAKYRDRACSYAIALDGGAPGAGGWRLGLGSPAIFIERHLSGKSSPEQCEYTQIASTGFQEPLDLWWRPELHGTNAGNVALLDGSVQTQSESMMERTLRANLGLNSAHALFPKRPEKH